MKKLLNFLLIGIIAGLSFSSCTKDQLSDNEKIEKNTDVKKEDPADTEEESIETPTRGNEDEDEDEDTNVNPDTEEGETTDTATDENTATSTDTDTDTDTNTANTLNYWEMDNIKHALTSCVIVEYGSRGNGVYDIELHLYTGTLREEANGRLNGTGNRLRLSLISSSETLAAGTYLHSNTSTKEGTLEDLRSNYGVNYINYNNSLPSNSVVQFQSGKVEVKAISDGYIIEFSLLSDKGENISGVYEGVGIRYSR